MKRKSSKLVKEPLRPKLDKSGYEQLLTELSNPERLAREASRLVSKLREEPKLLELRFAPDALAAAAADAAAAGLSGPEARAKVIEKLVDRPRREDARARLEEIAKRAGRLEDLLPYRIGAFLLDAEINGELVSAEGEPPQQPSPIWLGVMHASTHDALLALYLRPRMQAPGGFAALREEAAKGAMKAGFEKFLAEDAGVKTLGVLGGGSEIDTVLLHVSIGFVDARDLVLPFEAALSGPIEAARAAKRRQAMVGIGRAAPKETEALKILGQAIDRDAGAVTGAYRAMLLEILDEEAKGEAPATSQPGLTRVERVLAALIALEALPPVRNLPLLAAFEAAGPRAADEAEEWAKLLLHKILARPLDVGGYRAYATALEQKGEKAAAAAFSKAAMKALGAPEDEVLREVAGGA